MELEKYCQSWADMAKKLLNWNVKVIDIPESEFVPGEIVGFTFDNTLAHIKGFYDDPISGLTAILGGLYEGNSSNMTSMCIEYLRKATEIEKQTFNSFADIEGNPIKVKND